MSVNEAETKCIEYLMKSRSLSREAASHLLHTGLPQNMFSTDQTRREDPELFELVRELKSSRGVAHSTPRSK